LGFGEFQLNLGHIGYLAAALAETGITDERLSVLEQLIDRRNPRDLAEALERFEISHGAARTITKLPYLSGNAAILAEARALTVNQSALAAVDRLEQVWQLLEESGLSQYVIIDFGEIRNMDYYTGIVYRGYIAGLGFPVCGGGRYDGLLANFGSAMPAVGFAISLERAMSVTRMRESIAPDVLVQAQLRVPFDKLIRALREKGLRVEVDVLERNSAQLIDYGRQRDARRILLSAEQGQVFLYEAGNTRKISQEQLDEEYMQWNR